MSERELLARAIPADEVELHDGFDLIQYVADCLDRAGLQITPGPGYDHSGNDNHLVAGDHGPVITPQAGEAEPHAWVYEFDDPDPQTDIEFGAECPKGWKRHIARGAVYPLYRTAQITPQAGEAEPVKCQHCNGTGEIEPDNNGPIGPCPMCNGKGSYIPRTAPPRPVCDGNHAAPACADPECWQRPSPATGEKS